MAAAVVARHVARASRRQWHAAAAAAVLPLMQAPPVSTAPWVVGACVVGREGVRFNSSGGSSGSSSNNGNTQHAQSPQPPRRGAVTSAYHGLIEHNGGEHDVHQADAAAVLDRLVARMTTWAAQRAVAAVTASLVQGIEATMSQPDTPPPPPPLSSTPPRSTTGMVHQPRRRPAAVGAPPAAPPPAPPATPPAATGPPRELRGLTGVPRGVYLWGGVGTGKSLLMDAAYDAVRSTPLPPPTPAAVVSWYETAWAGHPVPLAAVAAAAADAGAWAAALATLPPAGGTHCVPARRVHYATLMLELHARVHAWKSAARGEIVAEREALAGVAAALAGEAWLLAVDEFVVNDIADAILVPRLLSALWRAGTVLLATSNLPPARQYATGLNRHDFEPFLALLARMCAVTHLQGTRDYRYRPSTAVGAAAVVGQQSPPPARFVVAPSTPPPAALLASLVTAVTHEPCRAADLTPVAIPVAGGRTIPALAQQISVSSASPPAALAVSFDDACRTPRGAIDYVALAAAAPAVVLYNVPRLTRAAPDVARRAVYLLDQLYEHRAALAVHAAVPLPDLFSDLSAPPPPDATPVPPAASHSVLAAPPSESPAAPPSEPPPTAATAAATHELGIAAQRAASRLHELLALAPTGRSNDSSSSSSGGVASVAGSAARRRALASAHVSLAAAPPPAH